MANTSSNFDAVLKRYMPYQLLVEEMKRRNYFWNKVKKKSDWHGGTLEFPFEGGEFSSLEFGALTAASDVASATEVMGTISTQPELWGTMKFTEKDLDRHQGNMDASYLSVAPAKIRQFVDRMSERISISLLNDGCIANITANNAAATAGVITVDQPERFTIGEKVYIDDGNSSPASGYVTAVNINTKELTIKNARSSGSAVDLVDYTVAQSAKVYLPGQQASGFSSLGSQLLTLANGGSETIAGQTKTAYPFLQALNISASAWTKATILSDIFAAFYQYHSLGKGKATEFVVPFQVLQYASVALQGNVQYAKNDQRSGYGWVSMDLIGPGGQLTLTGIRDMAASKAYILDWDALTFHGSKFFERKRFDGKEYFAVRETTGYSYLVDVKLYGDLVVHNPSHCAVIHSIPTLSGT